MKYSELLLSYFYHPKNVGVLSGDNNIGSSVVGTYENGALIHFYIQIEQQIISAATFKAYGSPPIIAGCSYATEWLINKSLVAAKELTPDNLMHDLAIPPLKLHCALLVVDAVHAAINVLD